LEEALSATELFCVLFFIVRNQYFSKIRQQKKAANHGWMRSDSSIDELEIAAPKARDDETKYLRPFLKFTKRYDKKRRRVFKLWLKNTSYRTIAEKLGISHGTARNWVERVITEFRGSLDIASPKPPIRKARKQRTLGKKPSTSSIGRPPLKGAGDEHN
jgi:DNA-directed RNA polymerase specialized sigma24 family protein